MVRNICTVLLHDLENGISILYHVIENDQLNRVNLTKCYIKSNNANEVPHDNWYYTACYIKRGVSR